MAKDVDLSQSIQTKGVYHPKLRARIPDMSMQLQASATNQSSIIGGGQNQ